MSKKEKKHEEDTDYTDEMGGGEGKEKPLTREGFFKMLSKISRPLEKPSNEEKLETSE